MSKIALEGNASGTGTFTIASPNSNSNYTLTLPSSTGTVVVTGGAQTIEFAAGSAASPSITFTGDPNTGIFSPAADTIAFAEGGAEAMRIDSSGNLNIGTTGYGTYFSSNKNISLGEGATIRASASGGDPYITISSNAYFTNTPDWKYVVTDFASSYEQYNGAHVWSSAASGTAGNTITFTERMRIDSSGNVGIGTSSPTFVTGGGLQISNATQANLRLSDTTNSGYNFDLFMNETDAYVVNRANGALYFFTNNTERARITSGGNFLLGSTVGGSDERMWVETTNADWCIQTNNTGSGTFYHISFRANNTQVGAITSNTTTTTYATTSDYRLKENIAPMTGALDKVAQLKPVTYTWKFDGSAGQGFIAHELQAVVPDCVSGEKDETEIEQYEVTPAVYEDVVIPAVLDDEGNEVEPERTEKRLVSEAVMGEREVPVYQGVDTSFLVATLTAAIQELKAITDAQATRIEALEAEVAALKGQ